jgi:hypothetical protein
VGGRWNSGFLVHGVSDQCAWEGTGLRRISVSYRQPIKICPATERLSVRAGFLHGQILASLETDGNSTAVVGLTMRLTANRHVTVPIGKRDSCLLVYRLDLLSSIGECCNQRLEP